MRTQATAVKQVRLPFGDHQVRSMLSGIKTVTRRPVRGEIVYIGRDSQRKDWTNPQQWGVINELQNLTLAAWHDGDEHVMRHRYGGAGDLLIGTECHRVVFDVQRRRYGLEYRADSSVLWPDDLDHIDYLRSLWNRGRQGWRSARFLPTFASRLRREIESVVPQRFMQVTCDSFEQLCDEVYSEGVGWESSPPHPFRFFRDRWDEIYGDEFPSSSDPWLRRIEFRMPAAVQR
jgi:hypothetical protein